MQSAQGLWVPAFAGTTEKETREIAPRHDVPEGLLFVASP